MTARKVRVPQQCARPGCPVQFLPSRSDQMYCGSKCKRRVQLYRPALRIPPRQP